MVLGLGKSKQQLVASTPKGEEVLYVTKGRCCEVLHRTISVGIVERSRSELEREEDGAGGCPGRPVEGSNGRTATEVDDGILGQDRAKRELIKIAATDRHELEGIGRKERERTGKGLGVRGRGVDVDCGDVGCNFGILSNRFPIPEGGGDLGASIEDGSGRGGDHADFGDESEGTSNGTPELESRGDGTGFVRQLLGLFDLSRGRIDIRRGAVFGCAIGDAITTRVRGVEELDVRLERRKDREGNDAGRTGTHTKDGGDIEKRLAPSVGTGGEIVEQVGIEVRNFEGDVMVTRDVNNNARQLAESGEICESHTPAIGHSRLAGAGHPAKDKGSLLVIETRTRETDFESATDSLETRELVGPHSSGEDIRRKMDIRQLCEQGKAGGEGSGNNENLPLEEILDGLRGTIGGRGDESARNGSRFNGRGGDSALGKGHVDITLGVVLSSLTANDESGICECFAGRYGIVNALTTERPA